MYLNKVHGEPLFKNLIRDGNIKLETSHIVGEWVTLEKNYYFKNNFNPMLDQTIHYIKKNTIYGQIDELKEKFDTQKQLDLFSYRQDGGWRIMRKKSQ